MSFKTVSVRLVTNVATFRSEMGGAGQSVVNFGRIVEQTSKQHAQFGSTMEKAGLVVGAALIFATRQAAQFEASMRNVASLGGVSEAQFRNLSTAVIAMSRTLPQSANDLAKGLYNIASSGFQGAQGVTVLKASAEAASAGLSDTATSAQAITGVLNAYGKGAGDAADVSDVLFSTVNLGVISFGELAGTLGQVVGIASQAGVGIDQVGSAIATMTLSGITADEATTSLNRVIQSLLQPSASLALLFRQLGYENGATALKTKGLHAVMDDLRKATAGNSTAFLALFPDIRAARGAMALASDEGRNYNRVAGQIEDANGRQGATHRALAEQMKSASAQVRLLVNNVNAGLIVAMTKVLPSVTAAAQGLRSLGSQAVPAITDAVARLNPVWNALASTGRNLVTIAGNLASAFGPTIKAFAALAGLAVVDTLRAVASSLSAITGFLANHAALVNALAVAYGVKLVASLASTAAAMLAVGWGKFTFGLYGAAAGADQFALSMHSLAGALTVVGAVAGVALLGGIFTALENDKNKAKEFVAEISKGADTKTTAGLNAFLGSLQDQELQLEETGKASGGWGNALRRVGEEALPFVANGVNETREKVRDLQKQMDEVVGFKISLYQNVTDVANKTGLARGEVEKLAGKLGIDLTKGFGASADERQKLIDNIEHVKNTIGLPGEVLARVTGLDVDAMTALAKRIDDVGQKIQTAFSFDAVAGFDPDKRAKALDAVSSATDRLASANDNVAKLERESKFDHRKLDDLAKARRDAAKATADLGDAQKGLVSDSDQLANLYTTQGAKARQFVADVQEAARRGLDPKLIEQLLTDGPEKAGPALRTMVADHSNRLINLANSTEEAMRTITSEAVEFGRLAVLAEQQPTDQLAKDIGPAMAIVAAAFANPKASVDDLAKTTHLSLDDVKRVAGEFGITIAGLGTTAATAGPAIAAGLDPAQQKLDGLIAAAQAVNKLIQGLPGSIAGPPVPAPPPQVDPSLLPGPLSPPVIHATGGIDAHTVTRQAVLYGERGTGGEAFIPRFGSPARAAQTLATAAGWYGMGLTHMAAGGVLPFQPISLPAGGGSDHAVVAEMRALRAELANQPRSFVRQTQFLGDMVMTDPRAATEYAERQDRLNSLQGV